MDLALLLVQRLHEVLNRILELGEPVDISLEDVLHVEWLGCDLAVLLLVPHGSLHGH